MTTTSQILASLNYSETFQNYERAYTEATGMPLTLRPVETWQLPFHGLSRENQFCALIAAKSRTCAACLQLQEKLTRDGMDGPVTRTCAYGLCESVVPVKLGLQTIGFLQTGQVLRQPPTAASFQKAVRRAASCGVDINNVQTKRAYFNTPVASPKKLGAVSSLLVTFADHLAMKSNQLAVQAVNVELPIITKAKQFIEEHYAEHLSLRRVSHNVNTSRFYFCKQFRQATGLSFTEFVSRTRIEQAKHLLPNPNLRISEIAFAAGFQSLGHFGRMFKRIVGQSPSAYREQLPAVALCLPSQAEVIVVLPKIVNHSDQ
jgi:AraC-like DNA-binding protein/ligand-binding sensor protein